MILLGQYKRCSICLILFFNLFELFPAFIFANNIGNLVNNSFGVNVFYPVPLILLFRGFNFILTAIVSSGSNFTSSSPSSGKSSSSKSRAKHSGLFRTFSLFFESSESLSYWVIYMFKSLSYNLDSVLITTFLFSKSFSWASLFASIFSVS